MPGVFITTFTGVAASCSPPSTFATSTSNFYVAGGPAPTAAKRDIQVICNADLSASLSSYVNGQLVTVRLPADNAGSACLESDNLFKLFDVTPVRVAYRMQCKITPFNSARSAHAPALTAAAAALVLGGLLSAMF